MLKRAEILSVGTELLMGQIVDTNAAWIAERLPEMGYAAQYRQTVGDNLERLTESIKLALSRAETVILIGGLGPTQDDLTRDGVAAALGVPLVFDPEIETHLRSEFKRRGLTWRETQLRQAYYPEGAEPLPNPNGTAPGLLIRKNEQIVLCLPGPPGELRPMFTKVAEKIRTPNAILTSRVLRICGMGENVVEHELADLMEQVNPTLAPYAKTGEVHIRLASSAPTKEQAERELDTLEQTIRERLGSHVYGVNEETIEFSVLQLLKERSETVCTAESITGGMLGSRLTSIPGSGKSYLGGVVVYDAGQKTNLLGLDPEMVERETPVSRAVAIGLAENARAKLGADWAIGTVGNAGPTSDEGGKEVGLVYIAISGKNGTECEEFHFVGTREDIRIRTCQSAFTMLRNQLLPRM